VSRQGRSSSYRAFLSFQTLFSFDGDRSPARSRLLFVLAVYGRSMFPCSGMKAGGPPVRLRSLVPGYAGETAASEQAPYLSRTSCPSEVRKSTDDCLNFPRVFRCADGVYRARIGRAPRQRTRRTPASTGIVMKRSPAVTGRPPSIATASPANSRGSRTCSSASPKLATTR
jgi:hypothetical protein